MFSNGENILQNLSYGYDIFGNLASRKDNLRNLEETFRYDKMNRLTDIFLGSTQSQICYDPIGRMTSKQADGQCVFTVVDAYMQDPASAQAFNRYAYCSHNPLRYTDPTGWYQQPGTYGINPNYNPGGHTTYHSDDPNDMLWGKTSHPHANSSGCINGNAVTRTGYSQGNTINITLPMGYATFHSHPSGNCESYITNDELRPPYYIQSPSDEDYRIAGSHTCYVFGRRDGYVYVYNREGTQAKIQTSVFISHT